MKLNEIINKLIQSNLYAQCPKCMNEFKLKDSILFDGTKPFPPNALEIQTNLKEDLKSRENDLKKRKKLTTEKAEITTRAVNIGKNLEKVLPTMKDFKWELPDCRFLGDPIDLITFSGLSRNKVDSINFIEVKSGGARLTKDQKSIRDAIEDENLSYKVI